MSTAKQLLRETIESTHWVVRAYVEDLNDADLLVRCVPGANHIAWQLGHSITATHGMLAAIGRETFALPEGFAEAHGPDKAAVDDPSAFATKSEYLALMDEAKAAQLAAVEATPEDELGQPAPERMRDYAPTVGAVLMITATHWLMHAGQFVPIRRMLGKKPLF